MKVVLGIMKFLVFLVLFGMLLFSGLMVYESVLMGDHFEAVFCSLTAICCMYFLGMLMERSNFHDGLGIWDIGAAIAFILFVLLGGLVYHGINAAGKNLYWLLFPHRKPQPSKHRMSHQKPYRQKGKNR
ncbi:hypothetical protein [Metabacillus indicus]|uniref:Uncharacterized protein n=1 Tax=Metabacillus indicus TaxID=246786 RepID=A0A084H1U6_METID|nr:hypothetical protein [Metabacillus indicus]KEZ53558.1 hypothetical protein GS18_0200775 [Metabacillus indicus]